jgi:hypothetical protein
MSWGLPGEAASALWRNSGAAIRATVLPFALFVLATYVLVPAGLDAALARFAPQGLQEGTADLVLAGLAALIVLLYLLAASCVAVAWHRHLLLSERPSLAGPRVGRIAAYAGHVLLIALMIGLPFAGGGVLLVMAMPDLQGSLSGALASLLLLVLWIVMTQVGLRLGLALPASALGRPIGLRGAWRASGQSGVSPWPATAVLLLLSMAERAIKPVEGPLGHLASLLAGWLFLMMATSVLSAFYARAVEGRPMRPLASAPAAG